MEVVETGMALQQPSGGGVAECRPGPTPAAATKQEPAAGGEEQTTLRRGPWTVDEDLTLVNYIADHGEGRWNSLARAAGLHRTGKSCRLRWLNYLRPDVKRGDFTADEQLLILDLHSRWGNRWSKIATHLPGRTDNEIKNYWRTRVQKHAKQLNCDVNSKRFKDAMRFLWMPRLAERAATAASGAGHAPPSSLTAMAVDSYDHDRRSPGSAAATASCSSTTTTSDLTSDHSASGAAGAPPASGDDCWAVAAAEQEFWSTASALQHLTAAADHRSPCCSFQPEDQDLISGWVQGFSEAAIVSSSAPDSLWSLDDIWRMP